MKDWRMVLQGVQAWLRGLRVRRTPVGGDQLMKMLEEARQEWLLTKAYFNIVTEKDLIDHAIFAMDAAEQRYVYLLKKAKAERLRADRFRLA